MASSKFQDFVCPLPLVWADTCSALMKEFQRRSDIDQPPPEPIVLGGWWVSSDRGKYQHWEATVQWADKYNCSHLIPILKESDCYMGNPSSDSVSDYFDYSIFEAVELADFSDLKEFIDEGIDINQLNSSGESPLVLAAQNHFYEGVQLLVDNGADLDRDGGEALSSLIPSQGKPSEDNKRAIKLLLDHGAPITPPDTWSALHSAASNRHCSEILELLFEYDLDVNINRESGNTPLMAAAAAGADTSVLLLVERGADLELKDSDGSTALDWAKANDWTSTCELIEGLIDDQPRRTH